MADHRGIDEWVVARRVYRNARLWEVPLKGDVYLRRVLVLTRTLGH
jgi:hypothetical protein